MLKVAAILEESIVDGPGIRTVIFLQGCHHRCEGCHNLSLLPFEGGTAYSARALADAVFAKLTPLHRGITLSGGDPLAQADALVEFLQIVRKERPNLTIWCYTGYLYEEVHMLPVLLEIDVLVDGPFILAQRDLNFPFRGSTNQRLIDIKASHERQKVVEVIL